MRRRAASTYRRLADPVPLPARCPRCGGPLTATYDGADQSCLYCGEVVYGPRWQPADGKWGEPPRPQHDWPK